MKKILHRHGEKLSFYTSFATLRTNQLLSKPTHQYCLVEYQNLNPNLSYNYHETDIFKKK